MKKLTTTLALLATASVASAFTLVTNGDFETPGGANWSSFASGGTGIVFETTGGNGGGYGKVDNSAGAWGGGLVSPDDGFNGGLGAPLATLNLVAGQEYTFSMDMINLQGTTGVGGLKIESWGVAGIISNSGDMPASGQSASWANYQWDYTIAPDAVAIKFVPLLTPPTYGAGQAQSVIGFDNVGVNSVPEPTSAMLLGMGALGLLIRRRK